MPDAAATYEPNADGTGRIVIDVPGKPVNVLSRAVLHDLAAAVDAASADMPAALRIESGKPGSFVAGADIFELQSLADDELDAYLKFGQDLFDRIANLPMPTTAVVDGACLGGGLELALACDRRDFKSGPKPTIGLPETTLGLVPGWGGTVRLPELIGAQAAAEMIVTGRPVTPAEAVEMGLDRSAGRALEAGDDLPDPPAVPPAPRRAVAVIRAGLSDRQAGLDAERAALVELRNGTAGRNLIRLFSLKQSAKKRALAAAPAGPRDVKQAAVVGGAGTMGNGIAYALAAAGYGVAIIEADAATAEKGIAKLHAAADAEVRKGRLSQPKADQLISRVRIGDVENADLIVEAASEVPAVKQAVFQSLGRQAKPGAVLATNTSSLGIALVADASGRPGDTVGLHFFNPVAKMPLVEVVRGERSSDDAVATAVAVALACRKTPIVCRDAPGFVVNRVLMPYLSEAMRCVEDGHEIGAIDTAAVGWGMPMGPLLLVDTIGLDVTLGIFEAMGPHLGDRVHVTGGLKRMVEAGRLGRKSGRGFYRHDARPAVPDAEGVREMFHVEHTAGEGDLTDRLVLPMINEGRRVLAEGVCDSADDLDLASVLGLGIAGYRGGVAAYDRDAPDVTRSLEQLQAQHGDRFTPAKGPA
jgi:3-hydroxyacyl-CoA dehydrogenase/enoyl-CoA hydratase/carnithine racemase